MLRFKNVMAVLMTAALLSGCASAAAPATAPDSATPAASSEAAASEVASSEVASSEAASPDAAASSDTTAAVDPSTLKPAELSWYFVVPGPQADQDMVYDAFNQKLKSKINATVNFNPITFGDYDQKLKVIIASGEDYDVCFTSNWTNNYGLNAAKGAFAPLDDLLAKYAPKTFAQVPADFWNAVKINGKIYGVVNEQVSARGPAYAINTEIAKKYNFDPNSMQPYDFSGIEPLIAAAKKDNPKAHVDAQLDDPAYFKQDFIAGWNIPGSVYVDDTTTKVFNQFESPEVVKFADLMRDFNTKGYTNGAERISKQETDADIRLGNGICSIEGAYKPGLEVSGFQRFGIHSTYVPGGEPILSTSGISATMQAISRGSKNQERATMLLEIMNTDQEMYNLLNFGIQDKHFTIDSDGFMVKTGDDAAKYAPNVPWMFATNYMAYVDKGMPKDVWDQTRRMNADAKRSPLLGFAFDLEPVKSEAGQCSAVVDEYYKQIQLGLATKDKYTEFLGKLKEAGSDKIVAEMQKQVDAWKAAK